MKKRVTYKSRQTVRLKMRAVLVICAVLSGLMIGSTLIVIQLFENETSMASNDPMVISDIDVFQDTLPILKGTSIQVVLGVKIQTKGKAQHLNLAGLELAARGTTQPYSSFISNARLWSTGNNDFFIPTQQIGPTLTEIPDENFILTGKQTLQEGDNYFWITFDINQIVGSKALQIDAECISVQIGTLHHDPAVSAPPGARRIQNNQPYYSIGNGDISSLDSWNSTRDGSGKRPTNFNQSNATFHIQSGHILKNNLNACMTYLVVERNGVLLSSSAIKSERLEIHGGGTVVQEKAFLNPDDITQLIIRNGGNYIHRNKGVIPGKTRHLEAYSNIVLNDYSAETFAQQIDWGNLIIDATSVSNTEFFNSFKNIRGSLEIRATGKENFLYSTAADTINISGDLVINGGRLALIPVKDILVVNVTKQFDLKSGSFTDALPGKSPKGSVEFNPGTRLYLKAGEFRMTGKHSNIRFHDEYTTWIQESVSMILPDITVMPGCTLKLAGKTAGYIAENRNFTVSSTAMLDCGNTTITGKGGFRLEQHGTLATSHIAGIHSDTDAGSIQTKTRYYSSSSDFIFNGSSSPQATGIFTTYPQANTVNQMTISKNTPAGILILQQDLTITGRLIKERGSINKNSHKLESGEQVTATTIPLFQK